MDLMVDAHGVDLSQVREFITAPTRLWPKIVVVKNPDVLSSFRSDLWLPFECWLCEQQPYSDVHHIFGGTKGRSDEFCNLFRICRECHEKAQSSRSLLPLVLAKKAKCDRMHTDWIRMTYLHRSFLPEIG